MTQTAVTRLLLDWSEQGDQSALAELMPLVCGELRTSAQRYLRQEVPGDTLQPTALVNELYLRLHGRRKVKWKNSAHFFGFAAQTMRRILVDHARSRQTADRDDGLGARSRDEARGSEVTLRDVVAFDNALNTLAKVDARLARIVELRFFVGLSVGEIAAVLEISPATVKREWMSAKMWLVGEFEADVNTLGAGFSSKETEDQSGRCPDWQAQDSKWSPESRRSEVSSEDAEGAKVLSHPQVEDEIGRLYDEIADLALKSESATDAGLEKRIEALWARLRRLQAEEAQRFHEAFEASLAMPIDAGARILAEARALRRELENTTSPDAATRESDTSQT